MACKHENNWILLYARQCSCFAAVNDFDNICIFQNIIMRHHWLHRRREDRKCHKCSKVSEVLLSASVILLVILSVNRLLFLSFVYVSMFQPSICICFRHLCIYVPVIYVSMFQPSISICFSHICVYVSAIYVYMF